MSDQTLLYTKPIPLHYALSLMVVINFSVVAFPHTSVVALLRPLPAKKDLPAIDSICNNIADLTVDYLVSQITRQDRENLRPHSPNSPKHASWSPFKRKAPFYDAVYNDAAQYSLKDYLQLACQVTDRMGTPWEVTKTGRPPHFDPKKLAAVILVKHTFPFSFRSLETSLRAVDFDARLHLERGGRKMPGHAYLHKVMERLPVEYLETAIEQLEKLCVEKYIQTFSAHHINEFVIDSTKGTCETYVERMRAAKPTLYKETVEYTYCTRLVTNTVKSANVPTYEGISRCDASGHLLKLPEGSVVLTDKQFDVETNHAAAYRKKLRYMAAVKTYGGKPCKGYYRKKNQQTFSQEEYKKRKLGERVFGNITVRGLERIKYRKESMRRKGELLTAAAHDLKAYFMQTSWADRFRVLTCGRHIPFGREGDLIQRERALEIVPYPNCATGGDASPRF